MAEGAGRPKIFGAGVSLGMLAGVVIGSLVTLWLGDAAIDLAHRWIDRVTNARGDHHDVNFELLLQ
jgi:hypothetical protein